MKDRECVVCYKTYKPKSWNQKVCSDACRKKYKKKMQPIWNKRFAKKHPTYHKDYYSKNKEKQDKYRKEWQKKNKTYLKEYRQQYKTKQMDDIFDQYYNYLKTID